MELKEIAPPPPYSTIQNVRQDHPTAEQGHTYAQGYRAVPTETPTKPGYGNPSAPPQYPGNPTPGKQPMPQTGNPMNPPLQSQQQLPPQANYAVVVQPQPVSTAVKIAGVEPKPQNNMFFSFCVCLCCNCPIGLIAIAFAAHSDKCYHEGNTQKAKLNGQRALHLSILGIIVTFIVVGFTTIFEWKRIRS